MCSNVSQSQKFCSKRILIQWTQVTTVSYRPMTNVVRSADKSQWTRLREFTVSWISADTICFRTNVMLLKNKANIIDFQPGILFHKATLDENDIYIHDRLWVYTRPISLGDFGRIFLSLLLTAATFIYQKYSNISHTVRCYLYFKLLFSVWKHCKIFSVGLGDMAQKMITIIIFISVDINNYHDKCQIFISFKFKARFLLQSEVLETRPLIFLNTIII